MMRGGGGGDGNVEDLGSAEGTVVPLVAVSSAEGGSGEGGGGGRTRSSPSAQRSTRLAGSSSAAEGGGGADSPSSFASKMEERHTAHRLEVRERCGAICAEHSSHMQCVREADLAVGSALPFPFSHPHTCTACQGRVIGAVDLRVAEGRLVPSAQLAAQARQSLHERVGTVLKC